MRSKSSLIAFVTPVLLIFTAVPAVAMQPPVVNRPAAELFGSHPSYGFAGSGVSTATGNYTRSWTDLDLPVGLLSWGRTYNSQNTADSPLGPGWSTSLSGRVVEDEDANVAFHGHDGRVLTFTPDGSGGYRRPQDLDADLTRTDGRFTLRFSAGNERWSFDSAGLLAEQSREGQRVTLERAADGRLVTAKHSAGYTLSLSYDGAGRLSAVTGSDERSVSYAYSPVGRLASVTAVDGAVSRYDFGADGRLRQLDDAEGRRVVTNTYDGDGRVTNQEFATGGVGITYDLAAGTTTVTNTATNQRTTYHHDAAGRLTKLTDAAGNAATQEFDGNGRLVAATSRGGARVNLAYDGRGNVVRQDFSGAVTALAYDGQERVASVTDPGGGVTRYAYSGESRIPSEVTDPTGAVTRSKVADGLVTEIVDPAGATTRFGYDSGRRLTSVTDPLGAITKYEYNRAGQRTGTVTPLGRATRDVRDAAGRVTESVQPSGARTRYRYSGAGRLLETTDPVGAVRANQYDATGNRTSSTDPLGRKTTFTYDADGKVATATDSSGGVLRYTYDALGRRSTVTFLTGAVTRYSYDADDRVTEVAEPAGTTVTSRDVRGNITATTDAAGRTTRYTYDANDRVVAETDAAGAVWRTTYDAAGRVTSQTDPTGATTRYTYDAAGRLITFTDPLGHKTQHRYDAAGRLAELVDPMGGVARYGYDQDGRRTSETTPAGLVTQFRYNADGQVTHITDPRGGTSRFEFSARGEEIAQIKPDGATHRLRYDAAGQLVATIDANGGQTAYTYDGGGNLTSLTDAKGATRTFGRDATGRERSFTDALGRTTRRTFDESGNLTSVSEPSGATVRTEYNAVGDVTRRIGADGSVVSFEYDAVGRRTGMTDATGTTRYGYDAAGRLLNVTQPGGGRFTMSYDAAGNRTSLQYPDGLKVSYRYDAIGNMIGLESKAGNAKYTLNPDGLLLSEKLPGGVEHRYRYSGDLLVRYEELRNGKHTRNTLLTRDSDGLITAQVDGSEVLEYRYDAADQLIAVRRGNQDVLRATYDGVGNRTSITRDGKETRLSYDAADQLVAADTGNYHVAYRYDPAGRLVEQTDSVQRRTISYNGFGLPLDTTLTRGKKTETRRATYDGDDLLATLTTTTGERDHTSSTTTRYSWSTIDEVPQLLTQDVSTPHAAPATADCRADVATRPDRADANFVYGQTRAFADSRCGTAVFAQDVFGSAVRTDETSPWVQATEYDTFGQPADDREPWALSGPDSADQPKFGYRGELALDNAVYLRARIYDTTTSRFTTRDPLATQVGQTDVVSPYAYANNSPQDYVDPTGEFPIGIGQFLTPILDGLVAALREAQTPCPDAGNSVDRHVKCFQGEKLYTRGQYKGVEWAVNGAEGPLSELWFDRRRNEHAARAFVVNYLSEEYDNFVEEFWDIFDKGLNPDVDWEVGPKSAGLNTRSNGQQFIIQDNYFADLVTKDKYVYEVKRWENGKNVLDVELQVAEYEYFFYRDWGIVWELGTELTDWADGFEVTRREGWFGFGAETADVIVWGADPGHIYFDEEKNVDDKTRAKIKAKTKGGKGKIGGKGPRIRGRR